MQHYNVKPIHLVLRPSYRLAVILAIASLGACIIVLGMPMIISLKILVCVPVILATAYFIAQDCLLCLPRSLISLDINARGELAVTQKNGDKVNAGVLPSSFVAAYLTVLNLKLSGSRYTRNMILMPGRVDDDTFRQLRVWLRWGDAEQAQNKTSAVSAGSDDS